MAMAPNPMEITVKIDNYDSPGKFDNCDIVIEDFKKKMHRANYASTSKIRHFITFNMRTAIADCKVLMKIGIELLSNRSVLVSVSMLPQTDPQSVMVFHLGGKVRLLETNSYSTFKEVKFCAHYVAAKPEYRAVHLPKCRGEESMCQILKVGKDMPERATIRLELELLPLDWGQAEDNDENDETHDLKSDIAALRKKTETADVKLICNGKHFLAHKLILSARSDVFAAMFSHRGTTEDESGEVHIDVCDHKVMEMFLAYLYEDATPASDTTFEVAKQLLNVANMFKVESLKKKSIKMLLAHLDEDNAIEMSTLGELFNLNSLDMAAKATISASKKPLSVLIRESASRLQDGDNN